MSAILPNSNSLHILSFPGFQYRVRTLCYNWRRAVATKPEQLQAAVLGSFQLPSQLWTNAIADKPS